MHTRRPRFVPLVPLVPFVPLVPLVAGVPLVALLLAAAALPAQGGGRRPEARSGEVTFSEHVAPILFQNCTSCHRPTAIGPFPLTDYQEARRKGKMIKRVTTARFMPPWHPVPGHGEFEDSRRLPAADIATIAAWVDAGMPEGDPARLPPLPEFVAGWQLGTPDLVLSMREAFPVPAGGPDIYRNFVLPLELAEDKWVAAVEIRPGAPTVLHHTLFFLDNTKESRRADGADGKPGFRGMRRLSGSLGGWAVGGQARRLPQGLAMKLPAGSDIVLSSHFHPSGKAELEKTTIGLFFAAKKPERSLLEFQIPPLYGALANLRIPAGAKNHRLEDKLTLPCDIELLTIGGHAHYLCRSMQTTALLPDGSQSSIFYIDRWAFNWQGRYQYKKPLLLPKGTVLHSVLIYDNSADNPQNPHDPPVDARWGRESTDEMGSVIFLATPKDEADVQTFQRRAMEDQFASVLRRFGGNRGVQLLSFELPKFDANQDGRIEFEEIESRWRRRLARQLDRNNDAVIDQRELAEAQERYANQAGGGRRR